MKNDGQHLENLVAFVEKTMLGQGFEVKTNQRLQNEEGIQIAEFDIEISGKVGSTNFSWLIECRDRPSRGPAPSAWIEQLVGRRSRFNFDKVTAVSTTGFAAGATEYAVEEGIELREVKSLTPEQFAGWLALTHLNVIEQKAELKGLQLLLDKNESEEKKAAALAFLAKSDGRLPEKEIVLHATDSGKVALPSAAFLGVVNQINGIFDDLNPSNPRKEITIEANYTDDKSHFLLETEKGPIRVMKIIFKGELSKNERLLPITNSSEYKRAPTGEIISQSATFDFSIAEQNLSLEMHRIEETGLTHVVVRKA